MTRRERFLRIYSEADWFAHLLLSTCILAVINFFNILSETIAPPIVICSRDYEIISCYFGPPPPLYPPRLLVLGALLFATRNGFKRTAFNRLLASVGLAVALSVYLHWWVDSYLTLLNYEALAGVQALIHPEIKHFAYLYYGTPMDLAVALSTVVCLVLLLDRLFDGEKEREGVLYS